MNQKDPGNNKNDLIANRNKTPGRNPTGKIVIIVFLINQ
jgi:hypothetical protein